MMTSRLYGSPYHRPQFQPQRIHPHSLIQTITAAKIVQEQQEARRRALAMQRVHPQQLIQTVVATKIAQKRTEARYARMRAEEQRAKEWKPRSVTAPDFADMNADTVVKLADFMAVLPVTFEKSFPYGVLTNTRVPLAADKVYSEDDILIIGAQLEMAKLEARSAATAKT